jgi:hypothetical protein
MTFPKGPLTLPQHSQPSRPLPDPIRIQLSGIRIDLFLLRILHLQLQRLPSFKSSLTIPPPPPFGSSPMRPLTLSYQPLLSQPPLDPIRIQLSGIRIYLLWLRIPHLQLQRLPSVDSSLTIPSMWSSPPPPPMRPLTLSHQPLQSQPPLDPIWNPDLPSPTSHLSGSPASSPASPLPPRVSEPDPH